MTSRGSVARARPTARQTPVTPLVLIPARMEATRLPGTPLAEIGDAPMIVQVFRRARAAAIGPVVVATDSEAIAEAVRAAGGDAVLTRRDHPSGSDRIAEAAGLVDAAGRHDVIVGVQGDFPTIRPQTIARAIEPLGDPAVDIGTLAFEITRPEERTHPDIVKAVGTTVAPGRLRALYFTRAPAPHGDGPLLHHVGLYAYRREALARFVALPPSPLERREKLEQLRALEAGMRIDITLVDDEPFGVDNPESLARARALLSSPDQA